MFDTVRIKTEGFPLNQVQLNQFQTHHVTYHDKETGIPFTVYTVKDIPKLPYIRYNDNGRILEIEVSIPKYVHGDNVAMIDESDIERFFDLLHGQLRQMFGLQLHSKQEWVCKRVDVCWNFQVGGQLQDYMRQLSMMRLPRMNTVVYNQIETVLFQNGSNRIMFYDKEPECRVKKCSEEVIRRAVGVLRMEISPPVHLMREYARRRTAADLLTMQFCRYVTNRVLPLLRFTMPDEFPSEWIQSRPISQIETALGFVQLYRRYGEGGLRQLFTPSTLRNRMAFVRNVMDEDALPPLTIDVG